MIIIAYLIGSISSAILICKLSGLPDPRTQGSGNPGATNVLRYGGKKIAVAVLLGDVLKGLLPVLAARYFALPDVFIAGTGFAAFFGHCFPIYYSFKGGKGVATALGVILAVSWPLGLKLLAAWIASALIFRFSSLAAIIAAVLAPVTAWLLQFEREYLVMVGAISIILLWRHKSNLDNLLKGTEPKIGNKD